MTKLIIGVYFHLKSINKKEGFNVILSKHTCWNHKCFWKLVLVIINPCDVRIFSMSVYMISLTICLYLKSEVFFILKDLLLSSFTFQEIFFCKTHVSIKQLYEKKLVFSFSFSFFFFFFCMEIRWQNIIIACLITFSIMISAIDNSLHIKYVS